MKRAPDTSQPGCAGGTWLAYKSRRPSMLEFGTGQIHISAPAVAGAGDAFVAARAFEEGRLYERRRQGR